MSRQMEAVLMIARHPVLQPILLPLVDQDREHIDWKHLNYGVRSGGEKAALSWAWCVWTDSPVEKGWRDPFESFGVMGVSLQRVILGALAHRWEVKS